MNSSYCLIIPCYRHGKALASVLDRLASYALPIIVVDDGNALAEAELIAGTCTGRSEVTLLKNAQNLGKGGAFLNGLKFAAERHYTHAIQLDADGQHCLEDLPKLIELSEQQPSHLISACPLYDETVPKARYYGRYATHFWVWLETLNCQIKDSLCGYRIYPVEKTLELMLKQQIGYGMEFDVAIMVHLYWAGVDVDFLPSKVIYPEDGISNFKGFKDNLRLSLMHTKLCIYMLTHLPRIVKRRFKSTAHWAKQRELKGLWGMRLMLFLVTLGGKSLFSLLLYPVIAVYYLSAASARHASRQYLHRLKTYASTQKIALPQGINSFRHFYSFGQTMLDKVLAWQDKLRFGHEVFYAPHADEVINDPSSQGKLILGSHLGAIETSRALAHFSSQRIINALVFTENAARFKQIMDEYAPESNLHLIAVNSLNMATIELLQTKIKQGEYIAILADRIPVQAGRGGYRVSRIPFLGEPAPFPQGPFILASILKCPVLLLHALKEQGQIKIYCEQFAQQVKLEGKHKQQSLEQYQQKYAQALERLTLSHPLEWFNFYDFWSLPQNSTTTTDHHAQD